MSTAIASGSGAPIWKVQAVLDYLIQDFPGKEVNHLARWDEMADRFRVIERSEVACQILVKRTWFDRYEDAQGISRYLTSTGVAEMMRLAGPAGFALQ